MNAREHAVLQAAIRWEHASTPSPMTGGIDILKTAEAAKELRHQVQLLLKEANGIKERDKNMALLAAMQEGKVVFFTPIYGEVKQHIPCRIVDMSETMHPDSTYRCTITLLAGRGALKVPTRVLELNNEEE